jgi:hypothetical protein
MTRIQAGKGARFPHLRTPKGSPRERGSEGTRGCHLVIRKYLDRRKTFAVSAGNVKTDSSDCRIVRLLT